MQNNRENWRAISGYDNYEVSDHGRVRSVVTGKVLKPWTTKNGYLHVELNGKQYSIHRLVALNWIANNDDSKVYVDHIDSYKGNNNLSNLRWASVSENGMNRKVSSRNKLGIKGVTYDKNRKRYKAIITKDGKSIMVGRYKTIEEAKKAYDEKAKELFGEFAKA